MTEQEIALANAKGLETRRRRWEQRNEKKRLAALAAEDVFNCTVPPISSVVL